MLRGFFGLGVCSPFFSPDRYTLLWIAADAGFARCVCFGTNARISCVTFGSLMGGKVMRVSSISIYD